MPVAAQVVDASHLSGTEVLPAGVSLLPAVAGWVLSVLIGRSVYRDSTPDTVSVSEVRHPVFTILAAPSFGGVLWRRVGAWRR